MRSIAGPARTWTLTSFDRLTRIMPPLRSGPLGPWLSRQRPSSSRSRYPTSISTPSPPTTSCAHGACRSESAITRAGCALGRPSPQVHSAHPQPHRSELDHSEEVGGELVVTGGDTAEVLQLGEEALDEVTLAVEPPAEAGFPAPVALGRDVGS